LHAWTYEYILGLLETSLLYYIKDGPEEAGAATIYSNNNDDLNREHRSEARKQIILLYTSDGSANSSLPGFKATITHL
jgi:hypothetical protein